MRLHVILGIVIYTGKYNVMYVFCIVLTHNYIFKFYCYCVRQFRKDVFLLFLNIYRAILNVYAVV